MLTPRSSQTALQTVCPKLRLNNKPEEKPRGLKRWLRLWCG